jgi:hypothetical protein
MRYRMHVHCEVRGDQRTEECSTCATKCGMLRAMTTTIEELMKSAADARRVAQNALRVAVREARAADWSWDRISAALGGTPNGETLRRNFGGDE